MAKADAWLQSPLHTACRVVWSMGMLACCRWMIQISFQLIQRIPPNIGRVSLFQPKLFQIEFSPHHEVVVINAICHPAASMNIFVIVMLFFRDSPADSKSAGVTCKLNSSRASFTAVSSCRDMTRNGDVPDS